MGLDSCFLLQTCLFSPTLLPLKSGLDQLEVERLQRLNPGFAAAATAITDTWLYLGLLCINALWLFSNPTCDLKEQLFYSGAHSCEEDARGRSRTPLRR